MRSNRFRKTKILMDVWISYICTYINIFIYTYISIIYLIHQIKKVLYIYVCLMLEIIAIYCLAKGIFFIISNVG